MPAITIRAVERPQALSVATARTVLAPSARGASVPVESRARRLLDALGSVPSSEHAREFLQSRVVLYLSVGFCAWLALALVIGGLLLCAGLNVLPAVTQEPGRRGLWAAISLLGCTAALGGALAWVRARPLAVPVLRLIEIAATLAVIGLCCVSTAQQPLTLRPDLSMMLSIAMMLLVRAVIVPSTLRLTALVSALAVLSVLSLTADMYLKRPVPGGLSPLLGVVCSALLGAILVALILTVSIVIYGLRARAGRAQELGQYTLLEKIGAGGMGEVYRAQHVLLRRPTAVKVLRGQAASHELVQRFESEVQLTADLSHPNIVCVYDFGCSADGALYYAMEYVSGIDLQRLVEEHGPLPVARVVHILKQAADALATAHALKLIHRDVKPANMMLCDRPQRLDQLKVLDFGLAVELRSVDRSRSSVERELFGTPLYMAPESILGAPQIDGRSDLYALGAVAYWLLTGCAPFAGKTLVEICAKHLYQLPEAPTRYAPQAIPAALDRLVLACLAKDPNARPRDAQTVRAALNALDVPAWSSSDAQMFWSARGGPRVPPGADLGVRTLTVARAPLER